MTTTRRPLDLKAAASGLVFLVGAGVYAIMQGPGGADFFLTPLTVGIIAIVAGLSSGRRRPLATGLVLTGWGLAVQAVSNDVVDAERVAPVYMLGIGAGLLATAAIARRERRSELMTSAAIAAFLGPLSLYLAYDVEALGRWPAWALTLVGLAAWELYWSVRGASPRPGTR